MEKKWPNVDAYKWRKTVALTPKEGIIMEEIYAQFGCENISQFCKKIVHKEIIIPLPTDNDDINVLKAKLAQYERIITNIKNELNT